LIPIKINGVTRILCLGAHSDDIEIGCGGTILRLIESGEDIEFYWMVMSSNPERSNEAQKSARAFLRRARKKTVVVKPFRDGFLPYVGAPVKESFEELKRDFAPDVIFTHYRHDLHQDHRLISELTWNTFRNHLILEYEIPKYDGDMGSPNFFVPLTRAVANDKVRKLMRYFSTQRNKRWFTEDFFYALMRFRGVESGSDSTYAEAYYCRKMLLGN